MLELEVLIRNSTGIGDRKEDFKVTINLQGRIITNFSMESLFYDDIPESTKDITIYSIG